MPDWMLQVIMMVLNNEAVQDAVAGPVGQAAADALPDVTEDALGNFLIKVGTKLKEVNP